MNEKIEFKDQKISKDDLNRILEAGCYHQQQKVYNHKKYML